MPNQHGDFPDELDVLSPDAIIDDVSIQLRDAGLSVEFISHALSVPIQRIRALRTGRPATFADDKLQSEVQKLATAALKRAFVMLEFGTTDQKMMIVKSVLSGLVRTASAGGVSEQDEARAAFTDLLASMSSVPPHKVVVTGLDFHDAEGQTPL